MTTYKYLETDLKSNNHKSFLEGYPESPKFSDFHEVRNVLEMLLDTSNARKIHVFREPGFFLIQQSLEYLTPRSEFSPNS